MSGFFVKLNSENARIPSKADSGAAGYDLTSIEDVVVPAHNRSVVDTGVMISIPCDCYARVAPRSGLALKHGIDVLAGVVDSNYRGTIRVILMNNGDKDYVISCGDRIAQLIFEKIYTPDLVVVSDLDATERGEHGFGSTGISNQEEVIPC